MTRVLFVDDEQVVLDGLANALRRYRKQWTMGFARGGEEALGQLADGPWDVIVTDARMPKMNGTQLLTEVMRRHPAMVRIALSGQTDEGAIEGLVEVAHQFLSKPCDHSRIFEVVERTSQMLPLLENQGLRRIVASIGQLPPLPDTYGRLTALLEQPGVSLAEISKVVEADPGIAARMLKVVNSAFFGLAQKVVSVASAVNYLGLSTVTNLVLSLGIGKAFPTVAESMVSAHLDHGLAVIRILKLLPRDPLSETAVNAALVVDVGMLVLAAHRPAEYAQLLTASGGDSRSLTEGEQQSFGATHAAVGAYLLGIWGLPAPLVEAVAKHHLPPALALGPCAAQRLFVADAACAPPSVAPELAQRALELGLGPLLAQATQLAQPGSPK